MVKSEPSESSLNGDPSSVTSSYGVTLDDYRRTHNEGALYRASLLSQGLIEAGLGPDEIVALHFDSLEEVLADQPYRERLHRMSDGYQFLLEVMIAYGVQYKQFTELRLAELSRLAEARVTQDQQEREELERAAQEKADPLAAVAHELRTPLTAVKGNVDRAMRSLELGRVERVTHLLHQA
jgi:signal transduction histidine kinase